MSLHIIPVNDLREHEESSTCYCSPSLEMENGEMLFIHNLIERKENKVEFDWVEIRKDFPKAFSKMTSWIKKNRFKKLNPTHLEAKPCEYVEGINEVSRLVLIPQDPNFLDKFFTDVLKREVKKSHEDIGEYFFEYENQL